MELAHHYELIPTWDNGVWTETGFRTQDEFRDFLLPLFKAPGEYKFNETSFLFNEQANIFNKDKRYNKFVEGSIDFKKYWNDQKKKNRFGAIFKDGKHTWYLPREYYMWINFLPINDKVKKTIIFPAVWDGQYHMALYELLAELHYKHAAVVKKRQFGSSYYHTAKAINLIWFEISPIIKIGASLKDYINLKGSWKFLDEYKSFLDGHTAWYRPMNPGKELMWQQQIEFTDASGRPTKKGRKGTIQGLSFEQSPTHGVGGACRYFFHEEAGIAPKMDKTVEYLYPAMEAGDITTGFFAAAGTVGELDKCEPLKTMVYYPIENSIYPVTTNLLDDKGTIGQTGLFIPEQWNMPPYIDKYGNSEVEKALEALDKKFKQWKKDLLPHIYQLRVSQRPRNLAEAFDFREASLFPLELVKHQERRIEDKEYYVEYIDLERDGTGGFKVTESKHRPITEFPIKKNLEDKTGVICVHERPDEKAQWGTYYGSIDPVSEGKTTTSESLCSIYIYKNPVEVTREEDGNVKTFIEQDKIVAWWTGRFDDINKTHERLEMLIEWYNAWTIIENNISLFISHMIAKHKQRYLVPKDQILFLKDLKANTNVFQEYGWRNVGTVFKTHIISYFIEFLKEEIDQETTPEGKVVKVTYGIERIPDIMVMKEMKGHGPDINVDRLVSIAALIAFAKVQQANRGYSKRKESVNKNYLEKSENLYKLKSSPFRHMGRQTRGSSSMKVPRSAFKNMR